MAGYLLVAWSLLFWAVLHSRRAPLWGHAFLLELQSPKRTTSDLPELVEHPMLPRFGL